MFNRFLNGLITFIPFFYKNNVDVRHYPDDIYVSDWKVIGRMIVEKAKKYKL
ncbi:MAG: hypothetical protein LBG48_05770 [Rickettsiales bacterium]|jgi:hypothetical protein|nr:hypothetical protein [Rickettsiales bacterium]